MLVLSFLLMLVLLFLLCMFKLLNAMSSQKHYETHHNTFFHL